MAVEMGDSEAGEGPAEQRAGSGPGKRSTQQDEEVILALLNDFIKSNPAQKAASKLVQVGSFPSAHAPFLSCSAHMQMRKVHTIACTFLAAAPVMHPHPSKKSESPTSFKRIGVVVS